MGNARGKSVLGTCVDAHVYVRLLFECRKGDAAVWSLIT